MLINTLRSVVIILGMLMATIAALQFSARALATPPPAASAQSHILVRIHELTGTGPDGQSHTLYRNEKGYTTTLNALGRVGSQVNGSSLSDGEYHTLYVRLGDKFDILHPDGSQDTGSFRAQDKPTTVRVRGMIMVRGGEATALHMLENPNYYPYPGAHRDGNDDD